MRSLRDMSEKLMEKTDYNNNLKNCCHKANWYTVFNDDVCSATKGKNISDLRELTPTQNRLLLDHP